MYKLNVLPVKLFEKPVSKNGMIFSHEMCDVCGNYGIKYEAVSYTGEFNYNNLKYSFFTYKNYKNLDDYQKSMVSQLSSHYYLIYYLCSEPCTLILQLQQIDDRPI